MHAVIITHSWLLLLLPLLLLPLLLLLLLPLLLLLLLLLGSLAKSHNIRLRLFSTQQWTK